jgi:hypothetical protein
MSHLLIPKRAKPTGTQAERKRHLSRVVSLGCIICGNHANAHHIRSGNGMSQKASDFETVPLCHHHHQGSEGIHTLGTKAWQARYGSERELLEQTRSALQQQRTNAYR